MTRFNLKPVINKANGQVNMSLGLKTLPDSLKRLVKSKKVSNLKVKLVGYTLRK